MEDRELRVRTYAEHILSTPRGDNITFDSSVRGDEVKEAFDLAVRIRSGEVAAQQSAPTKNSFERLQEQATSERMYREALAERSAGRFSDDFVRAWKQRRDEAYLAYTDPFRKRTFA